MIRLMKNEIIKLLKKKSFYIVTFIFVLFCVLTNIVYKTDLSVDDTQDVSIEELEEENLSLNLEDEEDLLLYVENLTRIRMEELKNDYSSNISVYLIEHFLYSYIYQVYESEYILEDVSLMDEYNLELDALIRRVEAEDYEYFLDERIIYLERRINATSGVEHERYQTLLSYANYRKDNHIPYDTDNYLHNSLQFLEDNTYEYVNLIHDDNLTEEEQRRFIYLEEEMSLHEYVIHTQEDIFNEHTLRDVMMNFSQEFGLFILIYVIMLAGSIVSEEYSRGTIKYLLTKPFKRSTILTSKLLVVLLLIPVIMLFMGVVELIIGGIILGFDSLSIPVVLYQNGGIQTFNVLLYVGSLLLSYLPMYLIIGLIAFMISTVTASTSAAITVSFLFYFTFNVIANLALVYDLPIFRFFVSLYWDFSYLVTGTTQAYGASIGKSCFVILIYLMSILCISYFVFTKKDVKNI